MTVKILNKNKFHAFTVGATPLSLAIKNKNLKLVKLLVDSGAKVTIDSLKESKSNEINKVFMEILDNPFKKFDD